MHSVHFALAKVTASKRLNYTDLSLRDFTARVVGNRLAIYFSENSCGTRLYLRAVQPPILPHKVKRQYLLTLQVSRYCLLALQGRLQVNCSSNPTDLSYSCPQKKLLNVVLLLEHRLRRWSNITTTFC